MNPLALLVAGALFMELLDGTVIVPALPHMAASLGTAAVDLQAAVSAYMLTVAVCILPSGWLAERYGVRRVFTAAVLLFTAASALCGFAQTPGMFVASRMLQGLGGAMMVPVGRLAVLRTTPKERIVHAVAVLTWPALTAPLLGPPLGGIIADYVGWRAIFFVNLPLGAVAAVLSLRLMPGGAPREGPHRAGFDWLGFVQVAVALAGLTAALDTLADGREAAWHVLLPAAAAAVAGVLLRRHVGRHPHPIVELSSLAIPTFRVALVDGTAMRMAISAVPFLLPLLLQLGFGRSAAEAGSLTLALFAGNLGIKPLTTPILRRWGFRTVLVTNATVQAASMLACALPGPDTPLPLVVVAFVVAGASRSMQFTALNTLVYADVPQPAMAMANALFSVAFQVATGFGIAVAAVVLRLSATARGLDAPGLADFRVAFVLLAAGMVWFGLRVRRLRPDAGLAVSGARRR